MINQDEILFAKSKEEVIIPSKKEEDAGYDLYSYFEEDYIVIKPHETKLIPTGIHSAFSSDYYIQLQERGSTGSKGIAQRAGVIDSGYRGEWLIPITNTTDKVLFISKLSEKETIKSYFGEVATNESIVYPYTKAICQAVLIPVPKVVVKEIPLEELKAIPSERGEGKLGSSNK